jgi:quercetin dioxygenase-like cupin family protein
VAESGETIEGYDSSITFVERTAPSGGERIVVEISYAGSGVKPPVHYHPSQEELFEVLEGEIHAVVDGEEHTLGPGDELRIKAGVHHQMWCEVPSRQRWTTMPAMRTERFFETLWGLQRNGKDGIEPGPSKEQMALTMHHFKPEFRLADPPVPLPAVVLPAVGLLARLKGLKPELETGR